MLYTSSSSESLIVDWIVYSLNQFIEELCLSLVTLAIFPCDGEIVESCDGEMMKCRDVEMVEMHVMFEISPCYGEIVQWFSKPIGVDSKVGRLIEIFEMVYIVT